MKQTLLAAALLAACSHATATSTDGGTTDAPAPALLSDAPPPPDDLRADRSIPDAPDRNTVCEQACALLTEPCADFPPTITPLCEAACAGRTEEQVQCAWAALSAPVRDVSRQCDELARCLDLDGP